MTSRFEPTKIEEHIPPNSMATIPEPGLGAKHPTLKELVVMHNNRQQMYVHISICIYLYSSDGSFKDDGRAGAGGHMSIAFYARDGTLQAAHEVFWFAIPVLHAKSSYSPESLAACVLVDAVTSLVT